MEFPTRSTCDPTNPEEAFLWMFVALPHVKGAPLMLPMEYYRLVSKRLWDLGCRPVEEPTLEWVPPAASDPHWMTSPGRWMPVGGHRNDDDAAKAVVRGLSPVQRAELRKVLEDWDAGRPLPDSPAGAAANGLTDSQRSVVLGVLRG